MGIKKKKSEGLDLHLHEKDDNSEYGRGLPNLRDQLVHGGGGEDLEGKGKRRSAEILFYGGVCGCVCVCVCV